MTTDTGAINGQPTKAEYDKTIDTILGSTEGRKQFLLKAEQLGLLEGLDPARLAFEFFSNPDFARKLCDVIWTASQNREVSP